MWRDLERICADLELPFRRPGRFPQHSVLAARIACRFASEPWLPDFVRAVFRANFAEDQDIAQPEVLEQCLNRLDLPEPNCCNKRNRPRQGVAAGANRTGRGLGIFGAPTFIVGDRAVLGQRSFWKPHWPGQHGGLLEETERYCPQTRIAGLIVDIDEDSASAAKPSRM